MPIGLTPGRATNPLRLSGLMLVERAKQAHSLVMTFEIFDYVVAPYVKCALFRVQSNAHVQPAQNKRTEAERETGTACGRNQV